MMNGWSLLVYQCFTAANLRRDDIIVDPETIRPPEPALYDDDDEEDDEYY